MPIGSFLSHVFRRLIIELVEFFVATQFVPLALLILWEAAHLVAYALALTGRFDVLYFLQLLPWPSSFEELLSVLIFFSVVLYSVSRLVKILNPTKRWWSVRRKASIVFTLITFGYMAFFAVLAATSPATATSPWVFTFACTIVSAVYGFGVRYMANKLLRRLQRFGIY